MARDELGDLDAFLVVAEERNFTRAAARLGRSQSSLSQTIRRLEQRLGLRLLTRTTRNVAPTRAGDELLNTLKPALGDIKAQLARLTAFQDRLAGTVRLTAELHAAETVLWPAIARLGMKYPDIQVELVLDAAFTNIVAEQIDAGVRIGERVEKDMIALRIGPDLRTVVVGSPDYLARNSTPTEPHDLLEHKCINMRLPQSGGLHSWEFEKDGREVNVRVQGGLILNNEDLAIRAAREGLGLAMVMEDKILGDVQSGSLAVVLGDWCPPFAGYHLYYPDRRHPSPAFAALLEELRANRQPG